MAIAVDATSSATSSGSVNSLTWSHTITGSNTFLFVCFCEKTGSPSQTGVTWNGTPMTALTTISSPFANNKLGWYLKNAATGTHNIVASRTTTSASAIKGSAVSYTGCDITTQPDNQTTFNSGGADTTVTATITPSANNCWQVCSYENDNDKTVSASTGATVRIINASDPSTGIFDSNGPLTGGVSNSMTMTNPSSAQSFGNTITITPVASAVNSNFLLFM